MRKKAITCGAAPAGLGPSRCTFTVSRVPVVLVVGPASPAFAATGFDWHCRSVNHKMNSGSRPEDRLAEISVSARGYAAAHRPQSLIDVEHVVPVGLDQFTSA